MNEESEQQGHNSSVIPTFLPRIVFLDLKYL